MSIHLSPGERNPIEGKFGQAKTAYGLNRIKARLKQTSESWIASIFLVLNLVTLAGAAFLCLLFALIKAICFSAKELVRGLINRDTVFQPEVMSQCQDRVFSLASVSEFNSRPYVGLVLKLR